jgi:hypothetical protein
MAEAKTKATGASVEAFLAGKAEGQRLADCQSLIRMMREVTGDEPKMWGPSIVGFGEYRYKYASGREGDWPLCGFSPRKSDLTVYLMAGFEESGELMTRLGKYKTGKSCLYVKKLADIDVTVLKQLVAASVKAMKERYG